MAVNIFTFIEFCFTVISLKNLMDLNLKQKNTCHFTLYPKGQSHLKVAKRFSHFPELRQGLDRHSSTSNSQSCPTKEKIIKC